MKKIIAIFAAAILLTSLTGCSESASAFGGLNGTSLSASQKAAEPQQIEAAIAEALGNGYYCTEQISEEELTLSVFNGLDLSKVKSYSAKQTAELNAGQDLIAIFQCKNGYADNLVKILNNYYGQVIINTMKHRHDVLKANGTRIYRIGDTVMFILAGVSPEDGISTDEEAALADAEYAKIDRAVYKLFGTVPENLAQITMDPSWARGL